MNGTTTESKPEATTTKRKRKTPTPRAPRTIDPGVKAIRDEAAAKVRQYHASLASGKILNTITEKLVPKLTQADVKALAEFLAARFPALQP